MKAHLKLSLHISFSMLNMPHLHYDIYYKILLIPYDFDFDVITKYTAYNSLGSYDLNLISIF